MSKVNVFDMQGNIVDEIELDQNIFGVEVNTYCMHAALVCMQANARQGTHSTLTKSEVSGGGKKPRRQKGGGCARQGSTRSAQWRHGGLKRRVCVTAGEKRAQIRAHFQSSGRQRHRAEGPQAGCHQD